MYDVEERHWWYAGLHQLILSTIAEESKRISRPLHIFDAGCGTGRLMQLMEEAGHRARGCDFSEEALRFCRKRGVQHAFQADLNSIALEPDLFDVITSIDVLYHTGITDDVAVMKRLHNGLKPGGILVLNLVAFEFLRSSHDVAVHTRERYTIKTVSERLHKAGFAVAAATCRVSLLFPFIAAYRLLARLSLAGAVDPGSIASDVSLPHPLLNALLFQLLSLENRLLRVTSLPLGSSVFLVARKPVTTGSNR